MCWINWFSFQDKILIENMNKRIKHRGPDGSWIYLNKNITFWQVRLSIIDLSPAWRQPLFYSKNIGSFYWDQKLGYIDINNNKIDITELDNFYWITFNWEIYNYQAIKDVLIERWYKFTTWSDTEVILAAYREYGHDMHNMLNGMWAFVIFDYKNNNLIFSRDRFWIKPLYYFMDKNHNIVFSSEMKAILEYDWYEKKPNEEMIYRYLFLKNDTDNKKTFFENIYKFPNANYWTFDFKNKELNIFKYWDLYIEDNCKGIPLNDRIELTKDFFLNSIKLHNISDVEVWACLSWWIDSSSIVCSLDKLYKSTYKLKTFSSIFKGDVADESDYINIVARSINSKNYFTSPTADDLEKDIEDLIYYQEEPFIWTSMYVQYKVMELANKNWIKVTLDGQWWDEVFGWYNTFYPFHLLYLLRNGRIKSLLKYIKWMRKFYSSSLYKSLLFPLLYLGYLILPNFIKRIYLRSHNKIVKHDLVKKYAYVSMHNKYQNKLDKFYYFHQMENIQHLLRYGDKNSMRWSVESRVPFLEKDLVEYVWKLPFDDKIKNGLPKNILREAMSWIIPDKIKNRYDKKWFETPENKRLKAKNMEKYITNVFDKSDLFVAEYIDIHLFKNILKNYFDNKNNDWSLVWYVLNLELRGRLYFTK